MRNRTTCSEEESQQLNSFQYNSISKNTNRKVKIYRIKESKNSESKFNFCLLISIIFLMTLTGITAYRYILLTVKSSQSSSVILSQHNQLSQPSKFINQAIKPQIIQAKREQMIKTQTTEQQQLLRVHLSRFQQQNLKHLSVSSEQYIKQKQQSIQRYKVNKQQVHLTNNILQDKQSEDDDQTLNSDNIHGIKQIEQFSTDDFNENSDDDKSEIEKQYSQNQLFDPIMKVRETIGKNFKTKFEDTPFIKKGTNITQEQYYKARDRMNLWKYFNVLTKQFQFVENGLFEPESSTGQKLLDPQLLEKMKNISKQQEQQYEKKYKTSQYKEIGFCLIIPSYKNNDKYFRNLNSIFQQDYSNYHVIYIDDASNDGTAQSINKYIQKYKIPSEKLNFIENKQNKKALANIDYAARQLCKSGEIMSIIDGDDYLIGRQVLKMINARYHKENLLALYTNHLRVHEPIYLKVGTCLDYPAKVKRVRSYRHFEIFPASHLRTFYVDMYWKIRRRDLRDLKGQYFQAANDFAIMMPILEMAGERFEYLPEITYIYDAGTGYNNFQTKSDAQARNFKITKRRQSYPRLGKDTNFAIPQTH